MVDDGCSVLGKGANLRAQHEEASATPEHRLVVEQLYLNALHENWQVRENAIETIGKSGRRESIGSSARASRSTSSAPCWNASRSAPSRHMPATASA